MSHKLLIKDIKNKNFQPIYFLHGEEPYYIDIITNTILENCLEEHEKGFNQSIIYGKNADPLTLINELKSFPMGSEKRLVVLKEAQYFSKLEALCPYLENPTPSSIFVICYKHRKYDARKKSLKLSSKNGATFYSQKVKEYQLNEWIQHYIRSAGYSINSKGTMLLSESLGNDLGRIVSEVKKLSLLLKKNTEITERHIAENIGVSKDYNVYELTNAVAALELNKAFKIISYFELNPKAASLTQVVSALFNFFSQILKIHFLKQNSREILAKQLKVHPFVAGELTKAKNKYSPKKIALNMEILQEYDLKSKGYGDVSSTDSELMKELVFKLVTQ